MLNNYIENADVKVLKVALFIWGDLIEDFLDTLNLSFNDFCTEMTGGWLFGYVEALKLEGLQTVIVCISAQVDELTWHCHQPTGATICVVPASRPYRWMRRSMKNPSGWRVDEVFGPRPWWSRPFWALLKNIAPYGATPLALAEQALQQEGCAAILCQEYEYPRFDACVLLGQRLKLPVFATFQGGNVQFSAFEKLIRPHTLRACAGLIVPSRTEIDRLQQTYGVPTNKIAQIFNPLDLTVWRGDSNDVLPKQRAHVRTQLGIPQAAEVVVYHGRMEQYRKGLDILLDAWEQLCQKYPDRPWWLLLVGTGSDAAALAERIACLPKPTVCWVNQYITDRGLMQQYLRAADLYVLPSRHEGFPVAPLEAMACGLPIIATEVPGVADILEKNEQSGGIRVPCNDVDSLTLALSRLLNDRDLRHHLGMCARQRIEESFSLSSVGGKLRNFIFSEKC